MKFWTINTKTKGSSNAEKVKGMPKVKVLIVEDEVIIADNLKRFLVRKGLDVIDIAISYEEAVKNYSLYCPDIILIDIRLNGIKTGIEVAQFIQEHADPKPFIFLTSQFDKGNIEKAKKTLPAAYMSKPVHKESLFIAIELAMMKYQKKNKSI